MCTSSLPDPSVSAEASFPKLEYDKEADAAYIYVRYPIKEGEAKNTIQLNDNIILDFDKVGKLIGVEVLDASKTLGKQTLLQAQSA